MIPTDPADEHRVVAGTFGERVRGVTPGGWDAPTPVAEWAARDVVRHLLEWLPPFLAAGGDVALPPGPSVDDDPVAAWEQHAAAVQEVLDDPASAATTFAHPRLPAMPLPRAVSQFYTADVFMHTWDLARATGQDDRLDEDRCRELYEAMVDIEEVLRGSGQYGPAVPVPADAGWQERMVGFIGRDPGWRPPG
ncbi:TIGR03086 family metal-binding protein (plasmid) [Georgenia sp. TF02-10]|uniref:TIGR03086 family metal-binding protein n=1 Tax=Georgenia sp. TF02-10 TaxID=2917725 RepID=UPI001FA7BAF6|nr:TIGR03086 family metal-binding protein [Georgenia sp. TF02-10]UNX56559.1 TIGR03086 family metal-binding protein [Georgenia sp. TF02-10]